MLLGPWHVTRTLNPVASESYIEASGFAGLAAVSKK
jgi:hypothetical protein